MESKLILKLMAKSMNDLTANELPLISFMKENDRTIENSSKHSYINECEHYLELLSNAFLIFNIKGENMSENYHSIAVCDQLLSITQTLQLEEVNDSIEKSLIELKTNFDDFQHKFKESIHHIKREQSFQSIITDKINFYSNKSKEYYSLVKTKENSISRIGFTSNLKQESIQRLRESNQELRESLVHINSRLNEFKDFMPTEKALRNKINEMKLEVNECDNYFNRL